MTGPICVLSLMLGGPTPVAALGLPTVIAQVISRNVCRVEGAMYTLPSGRLTARLREFEVLELEGFHLGPSEVTWSCLYFLPPPNYPVGPLVSYVRKPVTLVVRTLGQPDGVELALAVWDVFDKREKPETRRVYQLARNPDGSWTVPVTIFWPGTLYRLSATATSNGRVTRSPPVQIGIGNFYGYATTHR